VTVVENSGFSEAQNVIPDDTTEPVSLQGNEMNATAVVSVGVSNVIESVLTDESNVKCQSIEMCDVLLI